jgi:HK97 family phage portal protein
VRLLGARSRGSSGPAQARSVSLADLGLNRTSTGKTPPGSISSRTALRNSALWGGLRLRSNLVATLPWVVEFESAPDEWSRVEAPPFFTDPTGDDEISFLDWRWGSQFDTDGVGNSFAVLRSWWRDTDGAPRIGTVEPVDAACVTVHGTGAKVTRYTYDGREYLPGIGPGLRMVHERSYTKSGIPYGLSPIQLAQYQLAGHLSAQQLGIQFITSGAAPSGLVTNDLKDLTPEQIRNAKALVVESTANHEPLVMGRGWKYQLADVPASSLAFLEQQRASDLEVCRYIDIPADLVDVATSGGSLTYANITSRNLQFLIMSLGPALSRRESWISRKALPGRHRFRFLRDALLEMDPETRSRVISDQLRTRRLTPGEARALDGRAPYTESDIAEIESIYGKSAQFTSVSFSGAFDEGSTPSPEEVLP